VAKAYGLYLDGAGITDRATVIIDADGVVRHVSSVGPGGKRDIAELAGLCEQLDQKYSGKLATFDPAPGLEPDTVLYVRSNCMFSTNALAALENLHIDSIPIRNVSQDNAAMNDLVAVSGKGQAPCLVIGETPHHESTEIITYLAGRVTEFA
jgi:glutaredoxin